MSDELRERARLLLEKYDDAVPTEVLAFLNDVANGWPATPEPPEPLPPDYWETGK